MNQAQSGLINETRRHFLSGAGLSLGSVALGSLLAGRATGASLAPRNPTHRPRARSVIFLHMEGGPSHVDLFDPKPLLRARDGEVAPDHLIEGKTFAIIRGKPRLLGSPWQFARHGRCGLEMSELWKHLPRVADELCVIRSVTSEQFNHGPAQLLVHTGTPMLGGASLGSWITYGLGSENRNVPGFVVLLSGGKDPFVGKSLWGSGFLPTVYQGVQCRNSGDPILYLNNPPGISRPSRRDELDTLRSLNLRQHRLIGDPETLTRIEQYELTYRMQMEVPHLMDLSQEPRHILDLYGAVPGARPPESSSPLDTRSLDSPIFANNCLLARRLIEAGVRFVQLYDWGWDHHGTLPGQDLVKDLPAKCRHVDRAVTALLIDLKQRGLLEETLLIWGGEFGRTPMAQNSVAIATGRDHHPDAFCLWMAGGGVRPGMIYGATDEFGFYPTENPVHVHDLQATILHVLGLNPYNFSFRSEGLDRRLIGPTDEPRIVHEILA
jgi:hypothetical protein